MIEGPEEVERVNWRLIGLALATASLWMAIIAMMVFVVAGGWPR